jgi:hypothetical protein
VGSIQCTSSKIISTGLCRDSASIAEALDELEGKVGKDGRKKFEKFLRSMGEELDDEDDLIDVESK